MHSHLQCFTISQDCETAAKGGVCRAVSPGLISVEAATACYPREELHLVGVSGGVDSRVLLHLLPMVGFRRLVVCHLNHNLRGAESLEDSKFVYRLSHRLRLPLYAETLAELPRTGSLEGAAREARLQFFARAAANFSTSSVFLAHHADDQVETFLFNLFRGSGSLDNAAIKTESLVTVGTRRFCFAIRCSRSGKMKFANLLQLFGSNSAKIQQI